MPQDLDDRELRCSYEDLEELKGNPAWRELCRILTERRAMMESQIIGVDPYKEPHKIVEAQKEIGVIDTVLGTVEDFSMILEAQGLMKENEDEDESAD